MKYAENAWVTEDITKRYGVTVEQADSFLRRHSHRIIDGMVAGGWQVIELYAQGEGWSEVKGFDED